MRRFGSSLKIRADPGLLDSPKKGIDYSAKLTKEEKLLRKVNLILNKTKTKTLSTGQRIFLQKFLLKHQLPNNLRKELWLRGSGAKTLMADNPWYYQQLTENVPRYPNPCFYQIELDLHRTFSAEDIIFDETSEDKMRRVLSAYIKRNPTVGYCQGLNFIVAVLLHQLEEEEAFWVLCQIIESLLPLDYYNMMTGVIVDQKCFDELLLENFPEIHEHLESHHYS